jgi:ABC-type nitrate/sulfonate/bicarbonate transport system substrate-binding protein
MSRIVLLLIVMTLAACAVPAPERPDATGASPLVKVNACATSLSATQALPVYANDTGLFEQYGLDVNHLVVTGGSRAVPALTSGDMQFCIMAGGPAANAVAAGADLVVVGSLLDTYGYSLIVSKEIEKPADLKGKAVAVSTPGSASATAMNLALELLGLRPGVDVTVLALGGYPQRIAGLESQYIAGSVFDYPELVRVRAKGFRTLLDLAERKVATLQIAIVTTRSFLREHRTTVSRFVQAMSHAMNAVRRDRPRAIAALAKFSSLDPARDADVLTQTYEAVFAGRLKRSPAIVMESVRPVVEEAKRNHPAATGLTPESLVDLTIVKELEDNGFFDALEQ